MIVATLAASVGSLALLASGYLWGVHRGSEARDGLVRELHASKDLHHEENTKGLMEQLRGTLAPMLEQDKLAEALVRLRAEGLAELPALVEFIAREGSFSLVVLSDEQGLTLAASGSHAEAEVLAGLASQLFLLADRAQRSETARSIAVVVQDEARQRTLHRMFTAGGARYMLTAVSRGAYLSPEALDPALTALHRALEQRSDVS